MGTTSKKGVQLDLGKRLKYEITITSNICRHRDTRLQIDLQIYIISIKLKFVDVIFR